MSVPVTIVGNLTADPELRYTQSGLAVANFSIANTSRYYDTETNEWVDGDTTFLRGVVWRDLAEHVAGSLSKGDRVIATGNIEQRNWEKDGETRVSYELTITAIGPELAFATADVVRVRKDDTPPAKTSARTASRGSASARKR